MRETASRQEAARERQAGESGPAIELRSLHRRFGETLALDGLDMTVQRGDIHGFLGRNGAGKSTAIRILAGLIRPDSGEADLLGQSVLDRDPAGRLKAGFLVETPAFFPHLSGFDNLYCHALLMGELEPAGLDECINLFGLQGAARRKVGGYSLGMRQRLGLAQAFLGDPEVIILDEPANGLDPGGVISVRRIIQRYAEDRGTTFLISSHTLGEMERLCTRLSIIEAGRSVAEGTMTELGASGRVNLRVSDPEQGVALCQEHYPKSAPGVRPGGRIQVSIDEGEIPALVRLLVNAGLDVFEVSSRAASLEELFLDLVGTGDQV